MWNDPVILWHTSPFVDGVFPEQVYLIDDTVTVLMQVFYDSVNDIFRCVFYGSSSDTIRCMLYSHSSDIYLRAFSTVFELCYNLDDVVSMSS